MNRRIRIAILLKTKGAIVVGLLLLFNIISILHDFKLS